MALVLLNYDQAQISDYDEVMAALVFVCSHNLLQKKWDLDMSG